MTFPASSGARATSATFIATPPRSARAYQPVAMAILVRANATAVSTESLSTSAEKSDPACAKCPAWRSAQMGPRSTAPWIALASSLITESGTACPATATVLTPTESASGATSEISSRIDIATAVYMVSRVIDARTVAGGT